MAHQDTKTTDEDLGLPSILTGQSGLRLLTVEQVSERVCLSRRTIYNKVDSGEFPKPVKLPPRRIAFVEHEIDAWIEQLMEARS